MGTSAQPLLQPIAADLDRAGTRLLKIVADLDWRSFPDGLWVTVSAGGATPRTNASGRNRIIHA